MMYVDSASVTGYMAVAFDSRVQCLSRSIVGGSGLSSLGIWILMINSCVRRGLSLIVVARRHPCQNVALVCSAN